MIRIIGGKLKGRKLKAPKGLATRPVLARVREALFNVIGNIDGFSVLDLFAGTGAVGIEALSRGAQIAVFVDSGHRQSRIITDNLDSLGLKAEVIRSDAIKAIKTLKAKEHSFDFIFADPPYEHGLGLKTLHAVFEHSILSDTGFMAITVRKTEMETIEDCMGKKIFDRCYGDTKLIIFTVKRSDRKGKE